MSAKIDYTRAELTALKSQIIAQQNALGSLLDGIRSAQGVLSMREAASEEPNRDRIVATYQSLKTGVDAVNAMSLTSKSEADFLTEYDAATDPE